VIRLIFHTGPRAGTEVATTAEEIRIGRNPGQADLVLADAMCSQKHCALRRMPSGVYQIEDLGSRHGTLVNRKPVTRALLAPGDQFWVGTSQIEVGDGRPRLMVVRGPLAGVEVPIGAEAITLGSARDNQLVLGGRGVDPSQALLLCLPTGFALQDNRASNPTYVNGHAVDRYALADGDVIGIGEHEIRFLVGAPEASGGAGPRETGELEVRTGASIRGVLTFVAGPHEKLEIELGDSVVTLGRRGDCTVVLSDPYASGLHCQIRWTGSAYELTEIKATYGTYVNGQRLAQPVLLGPGDVIKIGNSVAEYRAVGGGTMPGMDTAASVIAEGAYSVAAQPKFVIDGHVIMGEHIVIGRAAGSDLFLEDDEISRVHAELRWSGQGFVVQDRSKVGTYLGGRRIVEEKLADGHVLRVGPHLFNVSIRGERLALERIDANAARAAIEVQRDLQLGAAAALAGPRPEGGYRTLFKANVADVEAMVAERKASHAKKRGAPVWRPTTDITGGWKGMIATSTAVAAAVALCVYFVLAGKSGAALINRPLAAAHQSKAFAAHAEAGQGCNACHTAGDGVPDSRCAACHAGFVMQAKHATPTSLGSGRHAPTSCASCHREHEGGARGASLGAPLTCKDAGCHPDAHAKELGADARRDAPVVLAGPPMKSLDLSQEKVHELHARIQGRCVGCHGTRSGGKADARLSCFRCHTSGAELARTQCRSCHVEHAGHHLAAPPDVALLAPAAGAMRPQGGGAAGALALAVFSPLFLLGLVWSLRSRRRARAIVAKLQEIPAESFKRLVHSINSDKCVGCSMCVTACPASVLELVEHKSVVVNFDACIQCKKCEQACNFDALRMHDADKPPPMVEMPDVDANNETAVAGLYLVGQAAGNPQIKNAANVGRKAIEHLARGLQPGQRAARGVQADVIIVGAGPGGLSAAMTAAARGLGYVLLEKSANFAATQQNYYFKGKHVMAEPAQIDNISRLPVFDGDRETMLAGWAKAIEDHQLQIHYNQHVTDVKKDGEVFTVTISDAVGNPVGQITALRVVLAVGTMANPRKLGCAGDHLPKVKHALTDPDELVGRNVLVVGGGDAGLEVALALGGTNKVWISMRGAGPERCKAANKGRLEEAIAAGKIVPLFTTTMVEVAEGKVVVKHGDGRVEEIANDVVFAMIGGIPPTRWLQSLGIGYVNKPHAWSPARSDEILGQSVIR
jgi:pSer/pThr/pTyr-binding forkhead associated (FHA) protein/thioredoxin reductase/formate hydrogenlyase subunit 6/NADH:ubiquinone oxidoreductase subunit I